MERAEATLVEHYPELVRLAYLTLPDDLGRHSRVLTAHKAVQRALPRSPFAGLFRGDEGPPGPDGVPDPLAAARVRVLRAVFARGRRARRPWPVAPYVWGLRLWPPAGPADAVLLGPDLAEADPPVRAAFVLRRLDGVSELDVLALLAAVGVRDPAEAVREAKALHPGKDLTGGPEFDACVVKTRPTDLLRRRRRRHAAGWGGILVAATLTAGLLGGAGAVITPLAGPAASTAAVGALDPDRLVRTSAAAWSDTARVDFTAWPARGARAEDHELLARALGGWGLRADTVSVSATPTTPTDPPGSPPQLLFAGNVDGRAVVLMRDEDRVVRYSEPVTADGPAAALALRTGTREPAAVAGPTLEFARTDEANVTTAAALVVSRTGGKARYLLAPWIANAAVRDLLRPEAPARPVSVGGDGLTPAVDTPTPSGACAAWPTLELTSSRRIVEKHSFLLADLGSLSPVHLTHTPLPTGATPAKQPREATGPVGRARWAAAACGLRDLRGGAVRAVNIWDFAETELPENAGKALWTCTRASGWSGPGDVIVRFTPAGGPTRDLLRATDTAACGRFGQHILADTTWKSPSGKWWLLAAGSREVTSIAAVGTVKAEATGRSLAAPAAGPAPAAGRKGTLLTAELDGGSRITALDAMGGGRD
ncbi:hypothetical protein ACN20G_02455 [Streptomyces sp. BI20]|uniref:hypothetical protein n=1 Tax=Streptomyces sp. BI20 TaxID=3403460 RepID=UPI003C7529EE